MASEPLTADPDANGRPRDASRSTSRSLRAPTASSKPRKFQEVFISRSPRGGRDRGGESQKDRQLDRLAKITHDLRMLVLLPFKDQQEGVRRLVRAT